MCGAVSARVWRVTRLIPGMFFLKFLRPQLHWGKQGTIAFRNECNAGADVV